MKTPENNCGARHRTLMLIYIIWLTVSLAPGMVAPPERKKWIIGKLDKFMKESKFFGTFNQGQPEMQQAMDNMVTRQTVIQKRINRSAKDEENVLDVNSKTSNLLAEAEKVLKTLPDSNERQWIESFVERMREIANMLEETAARQKPLTKDFNSVKGAPVPDGLPKQPPGPAASAVPEINPVQKSSSLMSKIQMTSPEINRVLPDGDHADHQAVTKPVQLQPAFSNKVKEDETDELVLELESLHTENVPQAVSGVSERINPAQTTTTISTPLSTESKHATSLKEESEKAKLKAKLIEEIEKFHRQGGVMPKEIIDILYADSHKTPDFVQGREINIDEEMKFTESGMEDRHGAVRLDDLSNEDREISTATLNTVPPYTAQQLQYWKSNRTFPNKHPNMIQAFPKRSGYYFPNFPPLNRVQPYQGNPQNAHQNLEKMNPYNQGKYQDQNMFQQPGYIPNDFKQKMPSKPHPFYNGRYPPFDYHNHFMRHSYGPYPYMRNLNPQNSTMYLPQMMPPYTTNQAKIDNQLSDEMKRDFRDGKIIVLSDSVVRSNFEPDNNKKLTQNTTEKREPQQMDMKNETTTEN